MAEAVARGVVPEFHGHLVARVVHVGVALDAHIGLAHHVELADSERRNAVVDAAVGSSVALRVIGEVERLTHLSRLEQRGIALGIYFRHLVFHGQHQHTVFSRLGAGLDDQAAAVGIHVATVLLVRAKAVIVVAFGHTLIQLVAYQPRGVVALQLYDDGQRVTQVVDGGQLSQRLLSLHVATHYATLQHDLRLVPEHILIDRLLPVWFQRVPRVGVGIETIVGEDVSVLHHTDLMLPLRYAD